MQTGRAGPNSVTAPAADERGLSPLQFHRKPNSHSPLDSIFHNANSDCSASCDTSSTGRMADIKILGFVL